MTGARRTKLVITGASGFLGRELVEQIDSDAFDLLLVSRNPPEQPSTGRGAGRCEWCTYDDLPERLDPPTVVLHLAAANSTEKDRERAMRVNVGFTLEVAEMARDAGVRAFVFVSSFHALDPWNRSAYAESKRVAARRVRDIDGLESVVMSLPAVHGRTWSGRLSPLSGLPGMIRRPLFTALKALRPTVDVRAVARRVERIATEGPRERHVLLSDDLSGNPVYRAFRATVDLGFAMTVLVLGSWFLAGVWLAVRLTSPGPGFFVQERVGKDGEPFRCWKFRTMRHGTPQRGTHEISRAAVTGLGRLLRRTKIDELPQAWNVLRRDLSVVGPRPCLPSQTELIDARAARGVHEVRPGITGLAQVGGIDMSRPTRLAEWDARYLHMRSVLVDVEILARTAFGGGRGDRTAPGRHTGQDGSGDG